MTYQLDLIDAAILDAMRHRPEGIVTYVIRNIVTRERGFPQLQISVVRRRLRRMERFGIVQQVPSNYAVQLCWRAVG